MSEALIIVDMQNDFVREKGPMGSASAREIIPNIVELAKRARGKKVPVIHVIQEHRRQRVDYGLELITAPEHCVEGSYGAKIIEEIDETMNENDDFKVIKRRFSGFMHTDLDLLLRELKINRVYVTGTVAEGCVRATALDAYNLGYYATVVADCIAGGTEEGYREVIDFFKKRPKGVMWSNNIEW